MSFNQASIIKQTFNAILLYERLFYLERDSSCVEFLIKFYNISSSNSLLQRLPLYQILISNLNLLYMCPKQSPTCFLPSSTYSYHLYIWTKISSYSVALWTNYYYPYPNLFFWSLSTPASSSDHIITHLLKSLEVIYCP